MLLHRIWAWLLVLAILGAGLELDIESAQSTYTVSISSEDAALPTNSSNVASGDSTVFQKVSSGILRVLPRPGQRRIRGFFEAVGTKLCAISSSVLGDDSEKQQRLRRLQPGTAFPCRPSRRPGTYSDVFSIPPQIIVKCAPVSTKVVFNVNNQIVDIGYRRIGSLEILMLTQRRGPVYYVEIQQGGDNPHYTATPTPLKKFQEHSCLNKDEWCFVQKTLPTENGYLVIDRHRIILYNYTWIVEGSTPADEIPDKFVSQFGLMNADSTEVDQDDKLKFPTAVAEYFPHNMTVLALDAPQLAGIYRDQEHPMFVMTPQMPHAWCRLLFVTDTGNHRIVMLNASDIGQFDFLGQFGLTGEARDNSTGFNWPWGVATMTPAWEARIAPIYANVFVADRRNNRLVKLNLGYPLIPCEFDASYQTEPLLYNESTNTWMCRRFDKPRLAYAGEYGREVDQLDRIKGLTDPTQVAVYKQWIIVCEMGGNAVTVLTIDHHPPFAMKFVTYFKPVEGNFMQGAMAVSAFGYVWYNYIAPDNNFYFTAMFLPEILREATPPSRFNDFLKVCINFTWFDNLVLEHDNFIEYMQYVLNISVINYQYPDEPDFVDIYSFNKSNTFDMNLYNDLIFKPINVSMVLCEPLPTPTPPPFFGGNEEGWVVDGKSQSEFTKRAGTVRPRLALFAVSSVLAVWVLVLMW